VVDGSVFQAQNRVINGRQILDLRAVTAFLQSFSFADATTGFRNERV